MENILSNINFILPKFEWIAYFATDFLYILAIIINVLFFALFRKKSIIKRYSDIVTASTLLLNSICLISIYFLFDVNNIFDLANGAFVITKDSFLLKFTINTFLLFFIMVTYKLIRRIKYKAGLTNSILVFIGLISSILTVSSNPLLSFILFDAVMFLIYEYASCMRIRENSVYSLEFLLISVCASILFYTFYTVHVFAQNSLLLAVLQVCIVASAMLKIGIFPIYNYTINKNYKVNLPYNTLLYALMPFLGYFALKDILGLFPNIENFSTILVSVFVLLSMVLFALNAFKTKNLVALYANISYFFASLLMFSLMLNIDSNSTDKLAYCILITLMGIFSVFSIIEINTHAIKLKLNNLKGLFLNNSLCAILYSLLALSVCCVLPNAMFFNVQTILKEIYLFDKTGLYFATIIFVCLILILFNVISSVVKSYSFDKDDEIPAKYTKRTTLNYVVPFVILLFLFFMN